jgi:hypothetical protein
MLESKDWLLTPSPPGSGRYASVRNYWREVNIHSIYGLTSFDGADRRKAGREVKGMNVEGIVAEDVEKAGGPGRVRKERAVGGWGVAVQRKAAN